MTLTTIAELDAMQADEIREYIRWAGDTKAIYEAFIENDHEAASFTTGWGAARDRSNGIHASEICGECLRPTFYSLIGTERKENISAFWKKRFRVGHAFHAMIQYDFHEIAIRSGGAFTFADEIKLSPELQEICKQWDIHSHADGILNFYDQPYTGELTHKPELRLLLELKTDSHLEFEKRKKPADYHREQACIYMKALDIPMVLYFYENKGNQNITPSAEPYIEVFDHRLWATMEKKMQEAHERAKSGKVPPKKESMKCEFCAFSWTCDPGHLKRKAAREKARKARKKVNNRNPNRGIRAPGG
jgi:hypothetical protein